MDNPDVEKVSLRMEMKWTEAESRIIQDIARRIHKSGKITSTADYQINRLVELGRSTEEIEKVLQEAIGTTREEMYRLYDDVANWQYVRNKDLYELINREFIPPEENEWLKQLSAAAKEQTEDALINLSQSYGFAVMMGTRKVFMPFSEYYQKYVDAAIMDIISGGFDYNTVIRRVVTQMTNSGLRTVDYASGHSNRTPVAVRRAVLTGVAQITGKIAEQNAANLGTEYYEVDWHSGARPEHRIWQGKVYSYKELETVCGLGTVTGLHGANCYHDYYPFIPGVSERLYTDEWLEEQNQKEEQTKNWNGKDYNLYEQTQKMRQMETSMRAQREKVDALKAAKADADEITLARAKYQAQLNEYSRFCKKMGLKEQRERIYYDMRGRIAPESKSVMKQFPIEMINNAGRDIKQYEGFKKILEKDVGTLAEFGQIKYNDSDKWKYLNELKEYIQKYPTSDKRYYDASEKLKELGIKKGVILPPVRKQAFILPTGSKDAYHIMNRMLERNITDDDVRSYMKNSKAMFVQWGGQRQLFVSDEGMCLITKQGEEWIYKTVWSKYDFDEDSEKIMEVLKSVGL